MNIQDEVNKLVVAVLPDVESGKRTLAQRVQAHLWPYVHAAAEHAVSEGVVPKAEKGAVAPEPRDKRVKLWQCVTRFWLQTANGPELMAETDPEVIEGTGTLTTLVPKYGKEMHGVSVPDLTAKAVKERLPQLRNNLGRQGSAVLRIEHQIGDEQWLCQVDVIRLGD